MIPLFAVVWFLFSTSVHAQMTSSHRTDGMSGTMSGMIPNSIEEYLESRRHIGRPLHESDSGISPHSYNGPNEMRRDSGTMFSPPFNTPMGNTPMGMPQGAPEIQMAPMHPWAPSMPAGRLGR